MRLPLTRPIHTRLQPLLVLLRIRCFFPLHLDIPITSHRQSAIYPPFSALDDK
jgi:hypothetical protein